MHSVIARESSFLNTSDAIVRKVSKASLRVLANLPNMEPAHLQLMDLIIPREIQTVNRKGGANVAT